MIMHKAHLRTSFILLLVCTLSLVAKADEIDSVGLERRGDQLFVLHQIEAKETLYALSRRYGVPIQEILTHNPGSKSGLEVNDTLRIPYVKKNVVGKAGGVHVVKPSETLFYISRLYNVSVDDLKKWNDLSSSSLNVGQEIRISALNTNDLRPKDKIHIVEPQETLFAISRKYNISIDQIKEWNELSGSGISRGQRLKVGVIEPGENSSSPVVTESEVDVENDSDLQGKEVEEVEEVKVEEEPEEKTREPEVVNTADRNKPRTVGTGDYKRLVEDGLASLIDGSTESKKYLALHRTAKVGTIMQIRNEMNNRVVFVRVLGKLPETGDNKNVLIRLSKAAYDRLGAINKNFRVEISYIP